MVQRSELYQYYRFYMAELWRVESRMAGNERWHRGNLWLLIVGILLSLLVSGAYYRELKKSSQKDIQNISTIYASRTENVINRIFHKTDVLAAVVKLENGQITKEIFDDIAQLVYEKDSGIRGIQYMPGAVVTFSYPLEGNEAVMGKNFLEIPERRQDALLAIDTKQIALSGPYHLIQGGLGVVARNPIFLKDDAGREYFWGFSAIVLDLPEAIQSADLQHMKNDDYDYQLFCINENGEQLLIEGNPNLDVQSAVCSNIRVPHHVWTLAVSPIHPWRDAAKAAASLLVGILLSLVLWQRYCLMVQKEAAAKAKDVFFSDISHDMRTPLNAVLGFAALAQKPGLSMTDKDGYIGKIQTAASLLLDLINDTLTISKANLGKLQMHKSPICTEQLLSSIMDPIRVMAAQKHITVSVDTAGYKPAVISADLLTIQKIFLNLLNNAVKYTPDGGHIWVQLRIEQLGQGKLQAEVSIRDNGIGMHQAFLSHIYEPFAQEQRTGYKGTGTGLGMAIVKQMVDLLQGTISVESRVHEGTEFRVSLPLEEGESMPAAPVKSEADFARLAGRKILVCEDNALNQEIICELLKEQGLLVDTAENGQLGVEAFSSSSIGEYDAILMDIRMPVMDGYEAVRRIRRLSRNDAKSVPVLALTADAFDDDVEKCLQAGMNGCLTKPVDMRKIMETLGQVIP